MNIFKSLDIITYQLSLVWSRLNTPKSTITIFGIGLPDTFKQLYATPISLFFSGFLLMLSVVFVMRIIRLFNILA